jgi:hypothetical protein
VAENVYIDEFDLTPSEDELRAREQLAKEKEEEKQVTIEAEKELGLRTIKVPGLGEEKKELTAGEKAINILFGPDIELAGDGFLSAGKVAKSIKSKFTGEGYEVGDVDPFTGFVAGIVDGTIKIPYGLVNLTAEVADALREDDVPVDQSYVSQLEKYFSNSVLGKIQSGAEDVVKETAVGKLTSALTQLYGYGRVAAEATVKAATKAKQIYNKYAAAAKVNKVVKVRPDAVNAALKAKELNKLTGKQNFFAVTVGGSAGASLVADVEDIGTWGDWLGGPTALDREQRETATDDALRKLYNRFKFFGEGAVVSVPITYGINKIGKRIAEAGKDLKYSDDRVDQWIAKYIAEPFSPAGKKDQFLFEGMKRVEGELAAGQVTARDLIIDIDKTLYNIAKTSGIKTSNPAWKRLIGRLDELLTSGDDVIQGGKIVFKGFDDKKLTEFQNFIKEIGLGSTDRVKLIEEMFKVRNQFNVMKNTFLDEAAGNLNIANKEFMQIMKERMNNIFTSEYKIFTDRSINPFLNYKPTESAINEVKQVFKNYAADNGIQLTASDLDDLINDVIKNVRFNPVTKTPEFPLTVLSVLDDNATQIINIADNIKGNQFKPTTLIQSEKDLRAFQRFFGQKRDLRNTIINTMQDLSSLVAKNRFYKSIADKSDELIANGQRAIVYPTRMEALRGLPNQKIIADKNGLNLKSSLGESVYTNPLQGRFTSETFKDALNFSERLITDDLAKSVIYQHLVLIPKGLTQISKTILGPFTHTRNFITSAQFALGTGNLYKNPIKMVKNFKQAFNTIQPQLAYRNLPKDQALYKFLLEEQVVSSSATARDIAGLLDDIGRGGDVYMRFFGKFGQAMKKIYEKAGDLYVAEDDFFKIYNFLSEFDSYKNAYTKAFNKGLIDKIPTDLQIMKEAAVIVKNTVPNYNYVGPFGQNSRRLPLGNFVSFPIEVTRTATNILQQANKELKSPIFKEIGARRALGWGTAVATAPAVVSATLKGMYGVTTATVSAIRELVLPSYAQDSTIGVIKDKEGNLKYIDLSAFFVYDTVQNPIQSVIASIDRESLFSPDDPLTVGFRKGIAKATGRFVRPYIDESIYLNTVNNLLIRKGVTAEGRKLWNEKAPDGEKIKKALEYALLEVAPFSAKQFERMYYAGTNQPDERGNKYELDDEIAGFYGLRAVKVKPLKSLNYKINDFKAGLRNTRSLFTSETLKGGKITPNEIINRYIVANAQRYKTYNEMKRKINAAEILNVSKRDLAELFEKRQESSNYDLLKRNKFKPFTVTEKVEEAFETQKKELRSEFEIDIPSGLPRYVSRILNQLERKMERIPLGDDFYKYINPDDYLIKEESSLPQGYMPQQPMPAPNIVPQQPVQFSTATGLTPTENALLSEEEKQIRLRQRGFTNYG